MEIEVFIYCPARGKNMLSKVGKVCTSLCSVCLSVFAKKSSPVFVLPRLRKFGKKQRVFFLQKTLPSLPTLHFGCLSLVNSGFLPLVKISGSFYVYILNSKL
jgi:hypothetical protein